MSIKVHSDERSLRVTDENGNSLELNENGLVDTSGEIPYTNFNKLFKELKRQKNKRSFSVSYYDEGEE